MALAKGGAMHHGSRILLAFGFILAACSGGVVDQAPPGQQGKVVSPNSGPDVTAAIASAALGDQGCPGSNLAPVAGSCAIRAADAAVGPGPCGGPCRPSTIQIQFTAATGSTAAHIEVGDVLLLDSTGATLENLAPSNPQEWDAASGTYTAWDQTVSPSSELTASYTLSSPSWSTLGNSYSATYLLRITLRIDGMTLVLQSSPLNREPLVAT
jgi:hypothetical protein